MHELKILVARICHRSAVDICNMVLYILRFLKTFFVISCSPKRFLVLFLFLLGLVWCLFVWISLGFLLFDFVCLLSIKLWHFQY